MEDLCEKSSLCIYDAVLGRLEKRISEETYLQCIVDHAAGARHGAKKLCNGELPEDRYKFASNVRQDVDLFASSMAHYLWLGQLEGFIEGKPRCPRAFFFGAYACPTTDTQL